MSAECASESASMLRIELKPNEALQLAEILKDEISNVRKTTMDYACKIWEDRLKAENEKLRREVEIHKSRLIQLEIQNGVKQTSMPSSTHLSANISAAAKSASTTNSAALVTSSEVQNKILTTESAKKVTKPVAKADKGVEQPSIASDTKKKTRRGKSEGGKQTKSGSDTKIDVSRLNMRIGFIRSVKIHPDADSLFVEEVDVGEAEPRTIVSGLVGHVSLEQMQERYAVFLLNLRPVRMRGILSEGMIMCAGNLDKFEIIQTPEGVSPGQRVVVDNFSGDADDQLNHKKKIWEQIQPDLRVNSEGLATYKGSLWRIDGRPDTVFRVPSLVDTNIS